MARAPLSGPGKNIEEARPVRAAVLRYRVMAYITGVVLIILCFVGIPLQGSPTTPRSPTTSARCTDSVHHLHHLRLPAGPAAAAGHRPDRAGAAGRHDPDAHVRGRALGEPQVHRPGAGRSGPAGLARTGHHASAVPVSPGNRVGQHYFTEEPGGRAPAGHWSRWCSATGTSSAPPMPACSPPAGWTRAPGCCWTPCHRPRPAGELLDLGTGYGPIALAMAARAPGATVWAVDVNTRALELCAGNAARAGLGNVRCVTAGRPRAARRVRRASGRTRRSGSARRRCTGCWPAGSAGLTPGGRAYLVVQRNLGADSLHRWLGEQGWPTARIASRAGYRVLEVTAR